MKRGSPMSIVYYNHTDGIQLITKMLYDGKLIPIIGSGFTKNCKSKKSTVPDGDRATEIMKQIISNFRKINLSDADFNKTSDRFFSIVPKKEQWNFFETYFTKVTLPDYLSAFLALPWIYIYTLNIDDAIERTGLYTAVLPYQDAKVPNRSMRLVYKLHGDAVHEVLYKVEKNIVFSVNQYIEFLTSNDNKTIYNAISSDYCQKNILFIGCSLANEPDLKYIYSQAKEDISSNSMRCIIRTKKPDPDEEFELEDYGINTVIIVNDFELFYREFVSEYENLVAQNTGSKYEFTNPKTIIIDPDNKELNLKYFSGENIFDLSKNQFYRSNLQVMRKCVSAIETYLSNNSSVVVRGRRFSGKTLVLSILAERYQKYTVFFFPSEYMIDEDLLHSILESSTETLFLFDSNSLSDYAYHLVAHSDELLKSRNNKLVVATNTNDIHLPDTLNAETVLLSPCFTDSEIKELIPSCDKYALSRRKKKETNIDYLKRLSDDQKIDFSIFDNLPKKFSQQELVLLMLLCIKDKLYFSDINALNIRFRNVDGFIERMHGIIERTPVARGENSRHSSEKLVHNSKYYLLSLMKGLNNQEIISTVKYIVSKLSKDKSRKRLYIETVLFENLNQLFGHVKGAGKLIVDIYEELESDLNQDMDYWLQRSKCIYRIYPRNYSRLKNAYQYAKKSASDGDTRIQAKAALTTSLICCLLAKQCQDEREQHDYEIEAITAAETAITSEYFKANKKNLKGELEISKRESYFDMILQVCNKHCDPSKDLKIAWKANTLKRDIKDLTLCTSI